MNKKTKIILLLIMTTIFGIFNTSYWIYDIYIQKTSPKYNLLKHDISNELIRNNIIVIDNKIEHILDKYVDRWLVQKKIINSEKNIITYKVYLSEKILHSINNILQTMYLTPNRRTIFSWLKKILEYKIDLYKWKIIEIEMNKKNIIPQVKDKISPQKNIVTKSIKTQLSQTSKDKIKNNNLQQSNNTQVKEDTKQPTKPEDTNTKEKNISAKQTTSQHKKKITTSNTKDNKTLNNNKVKQSNNNKEEQSNNKNVTVVKKENQEQQNIEKKEPIINLRLIKQSTYNDSFYYNSYKRYQVKLPDRFWIKKIYDKYFFDLWNKVSIILRSYEYIETNDLNYGLKIAKEIWWYYKLWIYKVPNSDKYHIYMIKNKQDIVLLSEFNPLWKIFSEDNLKYLRNKWVHYISKDDILASKSTLKEIKTRHGLQKVRMFQNMIIKNNNWKSKDDVYFLQFKTWTKLYIYNKDDKIWLINWLVSAPINSFVIDYWNYVIIINYGWIWNQSSPINTYFLWNSEIYSNFWEERFKELLNLLSYSFYVISTNSNYTYTPTNLYELYAQLISINNINDAYKWIIENFHYDKKIESLLKGSITQHGLETIVRNNHKLAQAWNVINILNTKDGVCDTFSSLLWLWWLIHWYNIEKIHWTVDWYNHSIIKIWNKYYDVTNDMEYYKVFKKYKYFWMNMNQVRKYMNIAE